MNRCPRACLLLRAVAALGLVISAPLQALQWDDQGLKRVALASMVRPDAAETSADFDEDVAAEALVVRAGRAICPGGGPDRTDLRGTCPGHAPHRLQAERVLKEHSLSSNWAEHEVRTARGLEGVEVWNKQHIPAMELQCISRGITRLVNSFHCKSGICNRYKLMLYTVFPNPKMNDRLARLWDDLLADPVPPRPAAARFETNVVRPLPPAPDRDGPSLLRVPDAAPSSAIRDGRTWTAGLAAWFQDLVELEDAVTGLPSAEEADCAGEAFSGRSIEPAQEAPLSIPSPFRWEPKRTPLSAPFQANHPFWKPTGPRHVPPLRPKIPVRPLHKQPFYRRLVFYLGRWLNNALWQESDPAA